MTIDIIRNSAVLVTVKPEDSSELVQRKQEQDSITLNFYLNEFVEIKIGDTIFFPKNNSFYRINSSPEVTERPNSYYYQCVFEGAIHELRKTKAILQTNTLSRLYQDYKFSLTGNAQSFLTFLVGCLNNNGGSYTAGDYKVTGTKTIEFNNWNVFEAITELSSQLGFSWYLEGTTIHFDDPDIETGYVFQVGRLSGFLELTRVKVDNQNIETVVYGYGSTENIPPRTADSGPTYDSPLLSENRLAFNGVGGDSKLEKNVDLYGRIESIQEFDDIKPEFTGEVDTVQAGNLRIFFDPSIDFNVQDYLLPGITPKITFLTGALIGMTFNALIEPYDASNQITLDLLNDESGSYPNDLLKPAAGDLYKIFDIIMPNAYKTDAQTRLEEATQAYLNEHSRPLESFEGKLDIGFIELNSIVLNLGNVIRVISYKFNLDALYEIKELTQKITNKYDYSVKFGDILPKGVLATLKLKNSSTDRTINNIVNNQVTNNELTNIIEGTTSWETL